MRSKTRLPVFWLGVAAASLALVCLLLNGQPHAVPRADAPPPEHVFPPSFIRAVPEVGLMSEVRESGPCLRAAVAAWPGDSGPPHSF
jgi:hypothetical protein